MAEPNSLEEACKANPSSTQSSGCAIVEDHEISGPQIGSTVISVRETSQCLAGNTVGPPEFTTDIGENSLVATDILINNEEEAREIIHFTCWLMAEQKVHLSLSNLDTAIFLFRHILDGRSPTHPLYSDVLRDLASTLGIRFMHTNQLSDLQESFKLRMEILSILRGRQAGSNINVPTDRQEDEDDIQATSEFANGLLTDFNQSTSPAILDTIIVLLQQALPHLSFAHAIRMMGLTILVLGLHARQHHFAGTRASDLNVEICGTMGDAIRSCTNLEQKRQMGFQIAVLSMERFDITEDISDLHLARDYLDTVPDHEFTVLQKLQSALELYERFPETGNIEDLNTAIEFFRKGIPNVSQGSDNHTACINNLANMLNTRSKEGGQQSDLDEAISLYRQALKLRPPPHPDRLSFLNNLANGLQTQFEQGGQQSGLDEAIFLHRQVLELRHPPHPDRFSSLNNLGRLLDIRFKQGGQRHDLDEAISLQRKALELRPPLHPARSISLSNLANPLQTRFEQGGQQRDLDEAIFLHRQALELQPPPHPNRSTSLNNLASSLNVRFDQRGQRNDLDEAISLHRQALELKPHRSRFFSLSNLGSSLSARFYQEGQRHDLDEAISLHRQALELPGPHSDRSIALDNLGRSLIIRFNQGGQQSDLDDAISLHRQALELLPAPHPVRSLFISNLAVGLQARFKQGGQQSDLDEAICLDRQALELRPSPHPDRLTSLNNLAGWLNVRFNQGGRQSDIDEAISLQRQALELVPPPHPNRSGSLNNLAHVLQTRFQQGGQQSDLDEAISLHRQALELQPPPHSDRSISLNNLANALCTQFQQGGQQSDLDEAISLHREALELRPPPHRDQSMFLNNLAGSLNTRFEQAGHRSDLDEVILLLRTATQYCFQHPFGRFDMSKTWIHIADKNGHGSLIAAYEAALQILPQVAALALTVEIRQKALISRSDGLARDASRCAIRLENLTKSVEFLEAGRSVFWSQVLSLRSPFDPLREITPDGSILADRLQNIARELEIGSHRDVSAHTLDNRTRLSIDQESSRLNRLNEEWDETILKVRKLPRFEDFLLSPRLSSLQTAASKHPIVLLIANSDESHCLIMTSTNIHHIPLPSLSIPVLNALAHLVRMSVSDLPISRSLVDGMRNTIIELWGEDRGISFQNDGEISSDDIFKLVLVFLWEELVKPIIDLLDIKKSSTLPILQWCPTGYFTFLPIHAAGIYDTDNSAIDCAADYFISSYTPTIGILLAKPSSAPSQAFKMMTVIQSQELPSTKLELQKIQDHVPDDALIAMGVPGSPAYVETVASRLSDASIVHFACHGYQNPSKPLESWLKLDDGQLRISRIMKEKMPNGALAFLSACETAMGDKKLPDEAMSLAASLLFCGFRRVVATMWMMRDDDGPTVADAFYRELFRGPDGEKTLIPDVTKSAYALHVAVRELRSRKVSFRRWVPFIHMGQC